MVRGLLMVGSFGVGLAAYAVLQVVTRGPALIGAVPFIASFACFGLLLGAIFAFDEESELKAADRPLLRVALSVLSGLSLALIWHWPGEAIALSVLVSGVLGFFGMLWAKYVDF